MLQLSVLCVHKQSCACKLTNARVSSNALKDAILELVKVLVLQRVPKQLLPCGVFLAKALCRQGGSIQIGNVSRGRVVLQDIRASNCLLQGQAQDCVVLELLVLVAKVYSMLVRTILVKSKEENIDKKQLYLYCRSKAVIGNLVQQYKLFSYVFVAVVHQHS